MARVDKPHFRLLGFPVRVGYGFVLFMALLAIRPGGDGRFGLWLALGVAGFTLLHELGHALVARRAGAEAGISLEFMAGYTSYRPTRPISKPTTIAISFAGPLLQIASGVGVLAAMGVNALDYDAVRTSEAAYAMWWAGPVIGLLNLIPVLPLDGGNVVMTVIDSIAPGKGRKLMIYLSLGLTTAAMVSALFSQRTRSFVVFIGLLLLMQLSALFEDRARNAVSPFDVAAAHARSGNRAKAIRTMTRGVSRPSSVRLMPDELAGSPDDALRSVLADLPRPLPHGDPWNEYLLATMLVRYGSEREAAEYAAARFTEEPGPLAATAVARAAASLGDAATTAGWLRAARDTGVPDDQLRRLVLAGPEFAAVRSSAEVQAVLGSVGGSPSVEPRRT